MADAGDQRCTAHKLRNLEAKAPVRLREELAEEYRRMIYAETRTLVDQARTRFAKKWRLRCPALVECLQEAGDDLFTFLRFPKTQWKALRTTNALERIGYSGAMSSNVSIEVDKHTADKLQMRAAELGLTVPQLIAELATLDSDPRDAGDEEIGELDRRYARATEGSRVPHDRVVQWLRTWGTPRFRQWPGQ